MSCGQNGANVTPLSMSQPDFGTTRHAEAPNPVNRLYLEFQTLKKQARGYNPAPQPLSGGILLASTPQAGETHVA